MAQYYDPREAATTFSLFANIEQTEREKELRKKEIEELLGGNKEEKADKFFGR